MEFNYQRISGKFCQVIGGIDFWQKFAKRFPKPVCYQKKGIYFSYLETDEKFGISLSSYRETAPNTLFIIRFEPDQMRKDCLIVLFTQGRKDANRYGIWFDCKELAMQEFGFSLFKPAETVHILLRNSAGQVFLNEILKEKENYFPLNFKQGPFVLSVTEENQKPIDIPIFFNPFFEH